MALKQALFFENNTTSQNADEVRLMMKGLLGGVTGSTHGVANATHFKVSEKSGTPNMSVDVAAGHVFIEGSRNSAQGVYHLYNDAVLNVPLSASDPTNPRIDVVYIAVRDSAYDVAFAGMDDAVPLVKQGVPAAVPAVPTITDEDFIVLAEVRVPALAGSVVNSNITDRRVLNPWLNPTPVIVPGQVLATATLTDGSAQSIANATNTSAAVDPSLACTFQMPESGAVVVEMTALCGPSASAESFWSLHDNSGLIADTTAWMVAATAVSSRLSYRKRMTGTPGATVTYRWGFFRGPGGGSTYIYYGGSYGDAIMQVTAA